MQLASALAASYVGGSVNFAAVSQSLNLAGPSMAAAMAADNVVSHARSLPTCMPRLAMLPAVIQCRCVAASL